MLSAPQPLTLFNDASWTSPYDLSCYVALREKGLGFSTSTAMVRDGQSIVAAFRDQAVIGRVPSLRHGDFWLTESMAIVEYLEEVFAPPAFPRLLPEGLRERARARQLMLWVRSSLVDLRRERPATSVFYPLREEQPPLGPDAQLDATELVEVMQRTVPGAGFLFGAFGSVDVDVAFALMRLVRNAHPVPEAIAAYAARVWAWPSVSAFVNHHRPPHPAR